MPPSSRASIPDGCSSRGSTVSSIGSVTGALSIVASSIAGSSRVTRAPSTATRSPCSVASVGVTTSSPGASLREAAVRRSLFVRFAIASLPAPSHHALGTGALVGKATSLSPKLNHARLSVYSRAYLTHMRLIDGQTATNPLPAHACWLFPPHQTLRRCGRKILLPFAQAGSRSAKNTSQTAVAQSKPAISP